MVATLRMNRLGYDTASAELPELPDSARERGRMWSDAVLHAVLTLKKQLTHQDVDIAAAAANSILELERTRMRHGKTVAGSELVSEAQLQFEEEESRKFDRMDEPKKRPTVGPHVDNGVRSEERAFAEHVEEMTEHA